MKMNLPTSLLFLSILAIPARPDPAAAQPDLYSFPQVEDGGLEADPPAAKPQDPFARTLAKKMNLDESFLSETLEKGFGRVELTRLILTASKSGRPLPDLVKEREKGTQLAKIARAAGQDNRKIRKEAIALSKEIEAEMEKMRLEAAKETQPTAGVSGESPGKTKKE